MLHQNVPDLADYIKRAISAIELMQTKENLRLVVLDLFEQLKLDNVIYAEMRFAPLEHLANGMTPDVVVDTVNQAVKEGTWKPGFKLVSFFVPCATILLKKACKRLS